CGTHQLLSTNTEAYQTDTDLLTIALRGITNAISTVRNLLYIGLPDTSKRLCQYSYFHDPYFYLLSYFS
ncbi:hypothetical protein, partial [Parabacteroides distasonis]|uniref:hypothetical protein n=1 Tax=Parabacteroides distasonis TaxID=823 RepID=UPI0039B52E97